MMKRTFSAISLCCLAVGANAQYFTTNPYLSSGDSPLTSGYLEDFEDGALNTPGVTASSGLVLGPGSLVDSVDGDDGAIDGLGNFGRSWYVSQHTVTFTFDAQVLGSLPTFAGLVWTDVGFSDEGLGVGTVTFEAFDNNNVSLGVHSIGQLGDGVFGGQSSEDTLFGVTNAAGISAITMTMGRSSDWEVDHLQYGTVPEPATLAVLGLGALSFVRRRRR